MPAAVPSSACVSGTAPAHAPSGYAATVNASPARSTLDGDTARFDRLVALPWISFPGAERLRVSYSTQGSWWYALRDRIGV